jgi:predicted Zn-dependent protease
LYRNVLFICLTVFMIFLSGCTLVRQPAPPGKLGEDIEDHPAVIPGDTGVNARSNASAALLVQACERLDNSKPDDAIDLLERAIALDPKEGRIYYYLARSWVMKGNAGQALEFNSLAEIYLGNDPEWHKKITEQKNDIHQME